MATIKNQRLNDLEIAQLQNLMRSISDTLLELIDNDLVLDGHTVRIPMIELRNQISEAVHDEYRQREADIHARYAKRRGQNGS